MMLEGYIGKVGIEIKVGGGCGVNDDALLNG